MSIRGAEPHFCAGKECTKTFLSDKQGNMQAQREGWFIQRNGKAWCPDHTPDWVAEWRTKMRNRKS